MKENRRQKIEDLLTSLGRQRTQVRSQSQPSQVSDDELSRYLAGELSPEERAVVRRKIASNPDDTAQYLLLQKVEDLDALGRLPAPSAEFLQHANQLIRGEPSANIWAWLVIIGMEVHLMNRSRQMAVQSRFTRKMPSRAGKIIEGTAGMPGTIGNVEFELQVEKCDNLATITLVLSSRETGEPLNGAQIHLMDKEKRKVGSAIVEDDAAILYDVPLGEYSLALEGPENFSLGV